MAIASTTLSNTMAATNAFGEWRRRVGREDVIWGNEVLVKLWEDITITHREQEGLQECETRFYLPACQQMLWLAKEKRIGEKLYGWSDPLKRRRPGLSHPSKSQLQA